jgi:hypothetical protein
VLANVITTYSTRVYNIICVIIIGETIIYVGMVIIIVSVVGTACVLLCVTFFGAFWEMDKI